MIFSDHVNVFSVSWPAKCININYMKTLHFFALFSYLTYFTIKKKRCTYFVVWKMCIIDMCNQNVHFLFNTHHCFVCVCDSTCDGFWYTEVGLDVGCYVCFEVPKFINIYYKYFLLRVCREFVVMCLRWNRMFTRSPLWTHLVALYERRWMKIRNWELKGQKDFISRWHCLTCWKLNDNCINEK